LVYQLTDKFKFTKYLTSVHDWIIYNHINFSELKCPLPQHDHGNYTGNVGISK